MAGTVIPARVYTEEGTKLARAEKDEAAVNGVENGLAFGTRCEFGGIFQLQHVSTRRFLEARKIIAVEESTVRSL